MYGQLVSCVDGRAIPLKKSFLRLEKRASRGAGANSKQAHYGLLKLHENRQWTLKALKPGFAIRVNGHPVKETTVKSGDLIALGKQSFRLELEDPAEDKQPTGSPAPKPRSLFQKLGLGRKSSASDGEKQDKSPVLGVLIPSGSGSPTALRKTRIKVGREATNDIIINDQTVSSLHCGFEFCRGYWRIIDLSSTNGIMVNGIAYQKKWLLPGEELMISLNRYRMEYQPVGEFPDEENVLSTSRSLTDIAGIGEEETDRIAARFDSLGERQDDDTAILDAPDLDVPRMASSP